MGKAVLSGQQGIISVSSGWLEGQEVNQVIYDPDRITVKQMEKLLKNSGTYIGRPKESE